MRAAGRGGTGAGWGLAGARVWDVPASRIQGDKWSVSSSLSAVPNLCVELGGARLSPVPGKKGRDGDGGTVVMGKRWEDETY